MSIGTNDAYMVEYENMCIDEKIKKIGEPLITEPISRIHFLANFLKGHNTERDH